VLVLTRKWLLHYCALCLWIAPHCWGSGDESSPSLFRHFQKPVTPRSDNTPHPAVVRVLVEESQAHSSGSGALVAAHDRYGLVVTNWHVVRESNGKISIVFPDGFRSAATILKTDPLWDLAALLIWRSPATPLVISQTAPQPGEPLMIAGYGLGDYRAVAGKCTQYVAPSDRHPYEIVELSVQARQGDSGGPILNERGELAGVLFGASRGSTSGSYCGRVRSFLKSAWPELDAPSSTPTVETPLVAFETSRPRLDDQEKGEAGALVPIQDSPPPTRPEPAAIGINEQPPLERPAIVFTPPPPLAPVARGMTWEQIAGPSLFDQAKTVLAMIGVLAVWGHLARWLAG
jgi:S1-C subfamily serine protease